MLLKTFSKQNACVVIHYIVWTEDDYKDPNASALDSFEIDYTDSGDKWNNSFARYSTLIDNKAEVKTFSIWDKDTLCVIVTVKSEIEYLNRVDRKLSAYGLRPYEYIK